ncbi:heme oxygenase-like domain-containing protein [Niabella hibiscisoli]|uniref:hypothetical protein n=1 Tax=Niabella hibiscisoli TaxID=1825928 RepID=UPI001F0E7C27|nr:hypothetical protein [Niabella hibiscisoli]MCH5717052.1 hypothetical protein [Niabella hibiscisoli]
MHTRLEQALFAGAIMDGSLTFSDYNKVLRVNYCVHRLLEPIIFTVLGERVKRKLNLSKELNCLHWKKT